MAPDSPSDCGGQAAYTLHEKANKWIRALDQETSHSSSTSGCLIKALHFTKCNTILLELESSLPASCFQVYCKENNLLVCFCSMAYIQPCSYQIIMKFIPCDGTFTPEDKEQLRAIEEKHKLKSGSILSTSWIKKPERRSPNQKTGNIKVICSSPIMVMSLPIRYSPMAFYFRLSIVFLTPQVLQHLLHRCDLLQPSREPSRNHHRLYPIPITPLVQYHIRDLSYDLRTTSLHFPFLLTRRILLRSDQLQIVAPRDWDLTICFAAHKPCVHFAYRLYLRLLYLLRKRRKFSPEFRLKFVSSHCFTSLCLCTFTPSLYFVLPTPFALLHHSEPPSCTISHPLILHLETISLLQNRTPQNHIGFTLRSPISTDLCHILGISFWSPLQGSFSKLVPGVRKINLFPSTHTTSEAAIAHVALHTALYIQYPTTPTPVIPASFRTLVKVSRTPF